MRESTRWEHAGINRFLPGHILCGDHWRHRFIALSQVLLDPHE
jgi:hypothetical protein